MCTAMGERQPKGAAFHEARDRTRAHDPASPNGNGRRPASIRRRTGDGAVVHCPAALGEMGGNAGVLPGPPRVSAIVARRTLMFTPGAWPHRACPIVSRDAGTAGVRRSCSTRGPPSPAPNPPPDGRILRSSPPPHDQQQAPYHRQALPQRQRPRGVRVPIIPKSEQASHLPRKVARSRNPVRPGH